MKKGRQEEREKAIEKILLIPEEGRKQRQREAIMSLVEKEVEIAVAQAGLFHLAHVQAETEMGLKRLEEKLEEALSEFDQP